MDQSEALQILKSGRSVFLTGQAGSGKTYVLKEYIKFLRGKGKLVGVTASTGVAATHLDGMTIHAWTGMGILDNLTKKDLKKIIKKKGVSLRIRNVQTLIIDEISMFSAGQLDIAEEIIRYAHGTWEPFGGMQVVFCGDFFQLPLLIDVEWNQWESLHIIRVLGKSLNQKFVILQNSIVIRIKTISMF